MKYEKLILSLTAALAVLLFPMASAEEAEDDSSEEVVDSGFERYQSILDRQPFGPPPPGFDPSLSVAQGGSAGAAAGGEEKTEAEVSAEEQKMMSSVRVSILNVTPSGAVMVGFTDSTTQPPVNYYLKVGDTSTDAAKWTVKAADPAAGTVTLAKGGVEVTLSVGGETKKGAPVGKGAPAVKGPSLVAGHRGGRAPLRGRSFAPQFAAGGSSAQESASGEDAGGSGPKGALERLRHRRMLKHAEEAAQKQAADNARAELEAKEREEREREREQAAAEREQQREALLQIQEELRRQREAKAAQKAEEEGEDPQE